MFHYNKQRAVIILVFIFLSGVVILLRWPSVLQKLVATLSEVESSVVDGQVDETVPSSDTSLTAVGDISSSSEWLTYNSENGYYRFDYPSALVREPDALPPSVSFRNASFPIDTQIDVVFQDATPFQHSLEAYLTELAARGRGLAEEKRIKIDGYDAVVIYFPPFRASKGTVFFRDVLFVYILKGDTIVAIRTEGVDHERVWNSFHFSDATPSTTWLTYNSKERDYTAMYPFFRYPEGKHYRFDYPSALVREPDALPPSVLFSNDLFFIETRVSVALQDAIRFKNSLEVYLKTLVATGQRLEKRIKIDGYDAVVTYYPSDRAKGKDAFFVNVIKGDTIFTIATDSIDHERVWSSFRFEE